MSRTRNRRRLVPEARVRQRRSRPPASRSNAAVSTAPQADAEQISRPRAAEIPYRPGDDRRRGRAEPGEKAEPADISRHRPRRAGRSGSARPTRQSETAAPLTSCSSNRAQKLGTSGNSGASSIPVQTNTSVTARVPNRSIKTPIWIDRNRARIERAPTRMPISRGVEPERQAVKRDQKGEEIDIAHAERPGHVERGRRARSRSGSGAGIRRGSGIGGGSSSLHLAMLVCWASPDCRAVAKAARCRGDMAGGREQRALGGGNRRQAAAGWALQPRHGDNARQAAGQENDDGDRKLPTGRARNHGARASRDRLHLYRRPALASRRLLVFRRSAPEPPASPGSGQGARACQDDDRRQRHDLRPAGKPDRLRGRRPPPDAHGAGRHGRDAGRQLSKAGASTGRTM